MPKKSLITLGLEKSNIPKLCIDKIEAKKVYPIEIGMAALYTFNVLICTGGIFSLRCSLNLSRFHIVYSKRSFENLFVIDNIQGIV